MERDSFTLGEEATLSRTITNEDIRLYVQATGDNNPVHTDEIYAQNTYFRGRISHGMLVAGLISALLGTKLPGPGSIYLSQQLRFLAPVRPGDTVTARATVTAWDSQKGKVSLATEVTNQENTTVIRGEAMLVMQAFVRDR